MRNYLSLLVLGIMIFLSGCATAPYVVKEEDKLTEKEKYHLFDYSRHFIIKTITEKEKPQEKPTFKKGKRHIRQAVKQNDLTPQERIQLRKLITSKDPDVRVRYTGPKQGKLSLSWILPGKLQVIVSIDGKLSLTGSNQANWRLNVIRYNRDCYMLPEQLGIPAVD